ncbi:hypothetical protein ACQP1O_43040 (plasmid) [Nocardia sp. CA-151230]|uniref:hypothetical protein n=1 Tax=Nocardia sp. CA-151230 TaxID=3239982 RepID=UPI003D91D2B3
MSIDDRVVYLASGPFVPPRSPSADRVTAYATADECPDEFVTRVSLKRLLLGLRSPLPARSRWWRLDDAGRFGPDGVEFVNISESAASFHPFDLARMFAPPRHTFMRFGDVWVGLTHDKDDGDAYGNIYQYSPSERWVRAFYEGPGLPGWALDDQRVPV